jgi:hypothetical protein
MKGFSQLGPVGGAIAAVVTAALGVAEIAVVASKPLPTFAKGGMITDGTTGTADDVPILASRGEFIVNAKATQQNQDLLSSINNGGGSNLAAQIGAAVAKNTVVVNNVADTNKISRRMTSVQNRSHLK